MWRRTLLAKEQQCLLHASIRRYQNANTIISIKDATFYRRYPSTTESNPPIFSGLSFALPKNGASGQPQCWSVISPSSIARTTFLQVLAGHHVCIPPTARSYPLLSEISKSPHRAIKYVGFDAERGSSVGGSSVRGAYLSARYESRREETDFSVHDYLTGHTELNALERAESDVDKRVLKEVVNQLELAKLLEVPVANLSNGQTRRTCIAKALMDRPEVLLLDGPFMGLDPNTLDRLSGVLRQLAERQQPRLAVSLRPEDVVPSWISHLIVIDDKLQILGQGAKTDIMGSESKWNQQNSALAPLVTTTFNAESASASTQVSKDGFLQHSPLQPAGVAVVEMRGVKVTYGTKTVLGDWSQQIGAEQKPGLWWALHRGQRVGIFGPNGSGKTTMLSLITSDHPQTYSLPIKLFGRSRLPGPDEPGISLFDIQKRMGHSSPEVHAFFPKRLTVRKTLESAWADAPMSKPRLTDEAGPKVNACLRWFAKELNPAYKQPTVPERLGTVVAANTVVPDKLQPVRAAYDNMMLDKSDIAWAEDMLFGELGFSAQRLALFLRAIVASPDLVILDEAFSGMDESTRDKALLFLSHGERVAHVEQDASEGKVVESIPAQLEVAVMEGLQESQALVVISHSKEDVPGCVREWICLPEPGEGRTPRTGKMEGPLELSSKGWDEIWGR